MTQSSPAFGRDPSWWDLGRGAGPGQDKLLQPWTRQDKQPGRTAGLGLPEANVRPRCSRLRQTEPVPSQLWLQTSYDRLVDREFRPPRCPLQHLIFLKDGSPEDFIEL